jgi:hypothetical protein
MIFRWRRDWQVGRVKVGFRHRPPSERMGRFGGGWQWEVGFQAGNLSRARGCVIVNLLVASVRVEWGPAPRAKIDWI